VALEQTELKTLIWDAYNADGEAMVQLYVTACERMQDGMKLQSSYDEQLLEDVAWRVERVRGERYKLKWAREEETRKAHLACIKTTIVSLQSSDVKCTCHDFFHWRELWRADPQITCDLRHCGHHLPHCTIARVICPLQSPIRPTVASEARKLKVLVRPVMQSEDMVVTSCIDHHDSWWYALSVSVGEACRGNSVADILLEPGSFDPDHYYRMRPQSTFTDEDLVSESESGVEEPTLDLAIEWFAPQNCFVGHGVFSECQRCKSTIEAGIMYYGCHKEKHAWTAACQELSFHHFANGCVSPESDAEAGECQFPGFISRTWARQAIHPQQEVPGSDKGVTETAYREVMEHCGLHAAFELDSLQITETGRLYKSADLSSTSRIGDLAKHALRLSENSNLHEYWEELRRRRAKNTSAYNRISDYDSEFGNDSYYTDDGLLADLKVPGLPCARYATPTFGVFRLRGAPFRLDPEWQLDDTDVMHAWQKLDVAKLRSLSIDFAAEATKLITSLGRRPKFHTDASTRRGRIEARLANVVQAWCAVHAVGVTSKPEVEALTELHMFQQSEATEFAPATWCDQAESMLRRFGLHVQGVPGEMVFHHNPTKRRSVAEQKSLFQKAGVYHALPFGFDRTHFNPKPLFVDRNFLCSVNRKNEESIAANSLPASHVIRAGTWEQLLVFESEFSAYNTKGMQRADPQAERWCGDKQCFDYTPFVTRADWLSRFREQRQREVNRAMLQRDRSPPHKWISSQWACSLEAVSSEISDGSPNLYNPSSSIWHAVIPEACDAQGAFSTAMDFTYSPVAPYEAFTRSDWERNCRYWNTETYKAVLEKHAHWHRNDWLSKSPAKSFWETWCAVSSWTVPPEDLLWVGGTYALHPSRFPAEQSEAAWIYDHLRPLGLQPSRFFEKLRRGAREDAHDWNGHLEDEGRSGACAIPIFPFTLTSVQQESMLSAHLWKYGIPSVWYGEGPQLELRRTRFKRIELYPGSHRAQAALDHPDFECDIT